MHKNNVLMLNLTAISLFCLLILAGLFRYSGGTILPATNNAGPAETLTIWVIWSLIIGIPLVTAVLWIARLWTKHSN